MKIEDDKQKHLLASAWCVLGGVAGFKFLGLALSVPAFGSHLPSDPFLISGLAGLQLGAFGRETYNKWLQINGTGWSWADIAWTEMGGLVAWGLMLLVIA